MDASFTKPGQFLPLVLHSTGPGQYPETLFHSEKEMKRLYRDDPTMWKIFRRLFETQRLNSLMERQKSPCKLVLPTVTFPDRDGMRCMCYENLMMMIKENAYIRPPKIYRIPTGGPPKPRIENPKPSWLKRALTGFQDNEHLQFPLATVVVRWQLKRKVPNYDLKAVKAILSKYGEIREMKILSPNSCIVTFNDITAACHVVQSHHIGDPMNKIQCTWWHKTMDNKNVTARAKGIVVKVDPFKSIRSGA